MLQDQQFIMLIVAWIREKLLNKDNARSNRMIPKENLEERVKQLEYELYPSVIAKVIK